MKNIDIGKVLAWLLLAFIITIIGGFLFITWNQADNLVRHPAETRSTATETPADYDLEYENITLTSADQYQIKGWYIPGNNGAGIILQHGYKRNRSEMLGTAEILNRYGYSTIMIDLRAHGESDGEIVRFGRDEYRDVDAAYEFLVQAEEVDDDRIGILGNSLGAAISILYAAHNENIRAVVADSPFYSLEGTIATSIQYYTGLPAFPFAPAIRWWAERIAGMQADEVSAISLIDQISPRPIFLMQGGADVVIDPGSGELLYSAAGEPKELWYQDDIGHVDFLEYYPEEYEVRITGFFDTYLSPTGETQSMNLQIMETK